MDDTTVTLARPGQPAPVSGRYEEIDANGRGRGAFHVLTAGKPAPSLSDVGGFRLIEPIEAKHTTIESATALRKVVARFDRVMRNLADR